MNDTDPALAYAACELIVGAIILLAAIALAEHAERKMRKRLDRFRGRDEK
jgi:hypothetical protein